MGLGDSYINPSKVIQKEYTKYYSRNTGNELNYITKTTDAYYMLDHVELSGEN
jgi:hypothetical protein